MGKCVCLFLDLIYKIFLKKVKSFTGSTNAITLLLTFGPQLLAIDESNILYLWDIKSQQLQLSLPFGSEVEDSDNNCAQITTILHPATYINKILLGFSDGHLQLWNILKPKLIYLFNGWKSKVTNLSQAPALHICAIGHESGLIVLHHLKEDQTLIKFHQEWGPVTSLSFRTDDAATIPMMVSSCSTGCAHLAVWNLETQRLETQMRNLHQAPISAVSFISKQPLLVTNSGDNSLKVWLFDDLQTNGRLLFQVTGIILYKLVINSFFFVSARRPSSTANQDSFLWRSWQLHFILWS